MLFFFLFLHQEQNPDESKLLLSSFNYIDQQEWLTRYGLNNLGTIGTIYGHPSFRVMFPTHIADVLIRGNIYLYQNHQKWACNESDQNSIKTLRPIRKKLTSDFNFFNVLTQIKHIFRYFMYNVVVTIFSIQITTFPIKMEMIQKHRQ